MNSNTTQNVHQTKCGLNTTPYELRVRANLNFKEEEDYEPKSDEDSSFSKSDLSEYTNEDNTKSRKRGCRKIKG